MKYLRSARVMAFLSVCIAPVAALAHGHLKSSVPSDGNSVSSPAALELMFTEALELKFSGISVVGPDNAAVAVGPAELVGDSGLKVPVSSKLGPGKYTVNWHILSKDGHKTHGTYVFTVAN